MEKKTCNVAQMTSQFCGSEDEENESAEGDSTIQSQGHWTYTWVYILSLTCHVTLNMPFTSSESWFPLSHKLLWGLNEIFLEATCTQFLEHDVQ